jgi:trimeric autotransporter adhesin
VTGTRVLGNKISVTTGDGMMLDQARKLTVGDGTTGAGNQVTGSQGYGLYAQGECSGSVVQGNVIVANAQGNVNLTNSRGIVYIP